MRNGLTTYARNKITSSYNDEQVVGLKNCCSLRGSETTVRSLSTTSSTLNSCEEISNSLNNIPQNVEFLKSSMHHLTKTTEEDFIPFNFCTNSKTTFPEHSEFTCKRRNLQNNSCKWKTNHQMKNCSEKYKNLKTLQDFSIETKHKSQFDFCFTIQNTFSILSFFWRRIIGCKCWTSFLMKIFLLFFVLFPVSPARGFENMEIINPKQFCQRAPSLSPQQRVLCRLDTKMFRYIEEGVLLSSKQCSKEFQNDRWNCTRNPSSFFKALINQDTKESAFVHALASAAVAHAVTTGCTKGDLVECGCDDTHLRSYDLLRQEAARRKLEVNETLLRRAASEFKWDGCGDNIDYGYKISRHFFNNDQIDEFKARVVKHNYEAGRLALKNHMERTCKCHGLTGTCTIHTCWKKMPKFIETSSRLRWRYNAALPVKMNNDMSSLTIARSLRRRVKKRLTTQRGRRNAALSPKADSTEGRVRTKRRKRGETYSIKTRRKLRKRMFSSEDLVYAVPSPSFCNRVKKGGSIGTVSRECNPNITSAGSCDNLCCGRGHIATTVVKTKPCRCKFKYCCEVICDECSVESEIYTCR